MKLLSFFALVFGFTMEAHAGDFLSYKQEKTPGFLHVYLEPTRMKVDISDDGKETKTTVFFEKEKEAATMIDHKSKRYTLMDKATVERMSAKLGASMAKMDEMLKKMPPEMRKMMKEKMGAAGGSAPAEPLDVKKTGSETVGKWKATRYEVLRGKTLVTETFTVPYKELGIEEKNLEAFKEMSKIFSAATKELKGMMGSQAAAVDMDSWKKMEGFPVKTVSHARKGEAKGYVLESNEKKSLSSADFELPSGYKKQELGKF